MPPKPPETYALPFRPDRPDGTTDWSRYCLQIVTRHGPSDCTARILEFPDRAAALAHARAIRACLIS